MERTIIYDNNKKKTPHVLFIQFLLFRSSSQLFFLHTKHLVVNMASALNRTLADLRNFNPVCRQRKICDHWIDMREEVVIDGRVIGPDYRITRISSDHLLEFQPFGHCYSYMNILARGLNQHTRFLNYKIKVEACEDGLLLEEWSSYDRMFVFDRAGSHSDMFWSHKEYNKNKTYRVISFAFAGYPEWRGRVFDVRKYVPYYIFYRQEVIPPPWQWMLRNGSFFDDLNEEEEGFLDEEQMELSRQWGIQRVQSNIKLLQVKWWYPFSLIKGFTQSILGCEDLYIPIANFLCALEIKERSYHHSQERKEFESKWTEEDHKKNIRLRGELYDMMDGLVSYNEERPTKKRRILLEQNK